MKSFRIQLKIQFKEGILDPETEAIEKALKRLEFKDLQKVERQKMLVLDIQAEDESKALDQARSMAQKLLVNTVMEDFELEALNNT